MPDQLFFVIQVVRHPAGPFTGEHPVGNGVVGIVGLGGVAVDAPQMDRKISLRPWQGVTKPLRSLSIARRMKAVTPLSPTTGTLTSWRRGSIPPRHGIFWP